MVIKLTSYFIPLKKVTPFKTNTWLPSGYIGHLGYRTWARPTHFCTCKLVSLWFCVPFFHRL